jgi:hypothetical protein
MIPGRYAITGDPRGNDLGRPPGTTVLVKSNKLTIKVSEPN